MYLSLDAVRSHAIAARQLAETGARSQLLTPWVRAEVAPRLQLALADVRATAHMVESPHHTGELVVALQDLDHAIRAVGRAPIARAGHRDALAAVRAVEAALDDSERAAAARASRPGPRVDPADLEQSEPHLLTGYPVQ